MYKTFTEWKNGNWLEDGEPRKEAYTKDELLLIEMGWKYGFDAGKSQTKPLNNEEIIKLFTKTWDEIENPNGLFIRFAKQIEKTHGIK